MLNPLQRSFGWSLALMLTLVGSAGLAHGEDLFDWSRERVLPKDFDFTSPIAELNATTPRPNRIPLFRIAPAFPNDPVGIIDDPTPGEPSNTMKSDDGPNWLQVAMGSYNPFFDVRRPGDPGNVGYYKFHSQLQLFDSPSTGLSVNLQAVTPAGMDQGGIEDGPTYISPAFAVFHSLDDGTAFQGFFGKNVHVNPSTLTTTTTLRQSLHYGMAVQRPVLPEVNNVYLFVEALGRYRYDLTTSGPPAVWEVLPGVHWKLADSWWISGGVVLPVNRDRPIDARLWQLTCSFQF